MCPNCATYETVPLVIPPPPGLGVTIPEEPTAVIPPVKYPHVLLDSKVYDLYTIGDALGIHDHALFNAFKKIVRRGRGEKSERQDLEEAAFSIQRCLRDLKEGSV
jgi:hypothetical protein